MLMFRRRRTAPVASLTVSSREPTNQEQHARLLAYELVMLRIMEQEAKIWQAPSLAMTAMAFLLTVALTAGTSQTSRGLAAGLSALIALISAQLMAKHRFVGNADVVEAARLERQIGLPALSIRRRGAPGQLVAGWPASISSYRTWLGALWIFALVSAAVVVIAFVWP